MKTYVVGAVLAIATIVGVYARAAQHPAPPAPTVPPARAAIASTIGIEGQVVFRHRKSEPVQAVPVDDKAPVVVRIADSTPDGEFVLYDLRFIAQYAGEFDLRDCLRRPDGSPLTNADALPITIGKLLPEEHQGELIETEGSGAPRLGGYRIALIVIGILWLIPPTWWVIRRLTRSAAPPPPQPAHPATLADQLRPLVEAAIAGTLSTPERAQLELLLLAYWRERLGLASHEIDHAGAIQRLREHPEAGELLVLLEQWLHRPPRQDEVVDVAAVLERYREARPIEVPARQGAAA